MGNGTVAGVNVQDQAVNYGGIPGAFGAERGYRIYSSDPINDPNYWSNRKAVADELARVRAEKAIELNQQNSGEFRLRQMGLADQLQGVVDGTGGPSVAQAQLDQATNANNMAAASTAASSSQYGMDPAAAFKAALQQQAMNNQNAAGQAGLLRANEVTAARGQLAGLFDSARGQDISQEQAALSAAIQQREQTRQYVAQLMQMGYTEDQAHMMAQVQQQQFQQGSLAQQEAAKQGISTANSAQGVQFGTTVIGGLLNGASAALGKPK